MGKLLDEHRSAIPFGSMSLIYLNYRAESIDIDRLRGLYHLIRLTSISLNLLPGLLSWPSLLGPQ